MLSRENILELEKEGCSYTKAMSFHPESIFIIFKQVWDYS